MVPRLSVVLPLVSSFIAFNPSIRCATISSAPSKAIASQTKSVTFAASSLPVPVDPCGPSLPDPRVVNSCSTSGDNPLQITSTGGPEPYAVQCVGNKTSAEIYYNQDLCISLIPSICARMTDDTALDPYTQNEWIWFNGQGCSMGYWLPGPYQDTNSAGQEIPVEPARITDQAGCELEIFGAMFDICFLSDRYDMATVNLAELPSKNSTGAPAPGGSAAGYPSYIIAPQQVGGCEDAICYNVDSVRVACNCL